MKGLVLAIFVMFVSAGVPSHAQDWNGHIVDSVNADWDPAFAAIYSPGVEAVGWLYTPRADIIVGKIETKFALPVDNRLVTMVLYDELPSEGGQILRQSEFIPRTYFSGSYFYDIRLHADEDYFIGFINLSGLGVNTVRVDDPDVTSLSPMYFSYGNSSFSEVSDYWADQQAILRFIPEPVPSVLLAGVALAALAARRNGRRRR